MSAISTVTGNRITLRFSSETTLNMWSAPTFTAAEIDAAIDAATAGTAARIVARKGDR